jgi:acetylornithine deacetylase/succinyl-diaminopimelate desuccinylase-like protein
MAAVDTPTITYTLRGNMRAILTITGPAVDLHSGLFGGTIRNPIHVLSELIAAIHDADGRVKLPGFYDNVLPIDDEERSLLALVPRDEAFTKNTTGAPALWGEPEYSPVERTGARPSLDVLMIHGGAEKSAIPTSARAIVSIRLVPDQQPRLAFDQLREFIRVNAPPTVTWDLEYRDGSEPASVDRNSFWMEAMTRALRASWDKEPLFDRVGGSIPAVMMLRNIVDIDSVLIGVYRPGDNLHGPNEKLHLPTWKRTINTIIRFLYNLEQWGK